MKILQRHILMEFGKVLFITVLSLAFLLLIIDIVENSDKLIEHSVPLKAAARFYIFKVPSMVNEIFPMAVLLSVLLSLGLLNRHGEITAIKASGIGLARILYPLVMAGLVISATVMVMNETITLWANRSVDSIEKKYLRQKEALHLGREGAWLASGNAIYNIKNVDIKRKTLQGISVYEFIRPFALEKRISADSARFKDQGQGQGWVADSVTVTQVTGMAVEKAVVRDFVFTALKGPEEFSDFERSYKKMGWIELGNYIRALKKEGYDTSRYRVELYSKISYPFVNLIMVLVAIPFALKTGRGSGISAGIGISIMISVGYWVIFGFARSLGQAGILPPLLSAFFPDIVFIAICTLMFGYVRQ